QTSAKSAASHRLSALSQTTAVVEISARMHSAPTGRMIRRVAWHFQPDSVDRITKGALHDVLPQVFPQWPAQHKLGRAGDRTQQLISQLPNPKQLKAEIKKRCEQHPVSAGLGATAALVLFLINFMPQSDGGLGKTASSLSSASTSTSTAPATGPATTAQTTTELSGIPQPVLEMASMVMPCQIGSGARQAIDQGNRYEYENGAVYYGAINNGQPADGQGTMMYPTGNRYEGDFQNGQRQGCGTFTFANGREYIGQFEADQFNGRGTWIIENGERYIGEFKNNQCSGQGTFIFANGSTKSGLWADGKLPGSQLSCDRGSLTLPSSQDM
ncbi:MAG: hypothetical protein AAFP03_07055, partial [Cyanobacteria bacterium J06598_3]